MDNANSELERGDESIHHFIREPVAERQPDQ